MEDFEPFGKPLAFEVRTCKEIRICKTPTSERVFETTSSLRVNHNNSITFSPLIHPISPYKHISNSIIMKKTSMKHQMHSTNIISASIWHINPSFFPKSSLHNIDIISLFKANKIPINFFTFFNKSPYKCPNIFPAISYPQLIIPGILHKLHKFP